MRQQYSFVMSHSQFIVVICQLQSSQRTDYFGFLLEDRTLVVECFIIAPQILEVLTECICKKN